MKLPSGYSTYDYSVGPDRKGWGQGWPNCNGGPTTKIVLERSGTVLTQMHVRIAPLVKMLLDEIERRGYLFYMPGTWGGVCRAISGTKLPSNHSWYLAFDMNAPDNPYTYSGNHTIPDWAFALLRAYGFGLGADYNGKKDWMHAEFMGTPSDADIMTELARRNLGNEDDMAQVPQDQWDDVYNFIQASKHEEYGGAPAARHAANAADAANAKLDTLIRFTEVGREFNPPAPQGYSWGMYFRDRDVETKAMLGADKAQLGQLDVKELAQQLATALGPEMGRQVIDELGKALS